MKLEESQTKENLMRAFAGESQARNRYTFASGEAIKQGYHMIGRCVLIYSQSRKRTC